MGVFRLDERNFCPHAALISDPINTQDLRMTYHFKRGEGSVEKRLRKIAASQIDKAIAEIDDPDIDTKETVHQVRKRAKKLRGLIRLVRPAFDDYKFENASFRDAASDLSYVRDAEANVETYDDIMTFHEDTIGAADFAPIRNGLVERRAEISCSKGWTKSWGRFARRWRPPAPAPQTGAWTRKAMRQSPAGSAKPTSAPVKPCAARTRSRRRNGFTNGASA